MSRVSLLAVAAACASAACPYPIPVDTAASSDVGASPGQGDDARVPTSFVTILAPPPGATVSDILDLKIAIQDRSLVKGDPSISVDGVKDPGATAFPLDAISLDSTRYSDGAHVIEVALAASDGRTYRAVVNVAFANALFRPESFSPSKPYFQSGEYAEVTVTFAGDTSGLSLTADFSDMDPAYIHGAESVSEDGNGAFTVRYLLSQAGSVPDGASTTAGSTWYRGVAARGGGAR